MAVQGDKNSAQPNGASSSWKKFLKWGAGIFAAVLATWLASIATSGTNAVYRSIHQSPNINSPLLMPPASLSPGNLRVLAHDDSVFFLPGSLSVSRLPKVADLRRRMLGPPVTSWYLTLNISGPNRLPVVITGMSIHIIHRALPRTVTVIHSCWRSKCTPTNAGTSSSGTAAGATSGSPSIGGLPVPVRAFAANLDVRASDINLRRHYFPFKVTQLDVEAFRLDVTAIRCNCKWIVYVDWVQGKSSGRQAIEEKGHPFRVDPYRIVRRYCYDSGNPRGYADIKNRKAVQRLCEA